MKAAEDIDHMTDRMTDRITNRMPPAIKQKLEEAAELSGATLNQFMVQASLEKAERVIDREKTIPITAKDAQMILHMLDNPTKPNAALVRAFKRFKQREIENGSQNRDAGERP